MNDRLLEVEEFKHYCFDVFYNGKFMEELEIFSQNEGDAYEQASERACNKVKVQKCSIEE